MQYVFAGVLVVGGAMLVGLAYHNKVAEAWQTIIS